MRIFDQNDVTTAKRAHLAITDLDDDLSIEEYNPLLLRRATPVMVVAGVGFTEKNAATGQLEGQFANIAACIQRHVEFREVRYPVGISEDSGRFHDDDW